MNIHDFPQEIKDRIMECQVEQGNKADLSVFETCKSKGKTEDGFEWGETREGTYFWDDIMREDFKPFYELYPKSELPKRGDMVLVWDEHKEYAKETIFVAYIDNAIYPVLCVADRSEKSFKEGNPFHYMQYKHYELLPKQKQIVELTLQDISEGKGKGVPAHLIRIKE